MKTVEEYKKILKASDTEDLEFPKDIDWDQVESRFEALLGDLKNDFRVIWVDGLGSIQDASFHGAIVFESVEPDGLHAVRLSNFGSLATIDDDRQLPTAIVSKLLAILEENGYQYIPYTVLKMPYDGAYEYFKIFRDREGTWLDRYFDYV